MTKREKLLALKKIKVELLTLLSVGFLNNKLTNHFITDFDDSTMNRRNRNKYDNYLESSQELKKYPSEIVFGNYKLQKTNFNFTLFLKKIADL